MARLNATLPVDAQIGQDKKKPNRERSGFVDWSWGLLNEPLEPAWMLGFSNINCDLFPHLFPRFAPDTIQTGGPYTSGSGPPTLNRGHPATHTEYHPPRQCRKLARERRPIHPRGVTPGSTLTVQPGQRSTVRGVDHGPPNCRLPVCRLPAPASFCR